MIITLAFCSSAEKREIKGKDGKPYAWVQEEEVEDGKKRLVGVEYDQNRNGKVEHWITYDDSGMMKSVEVDKNEDEKKDFVVHYQPNDEKSGKKKYRRNQVDKLDENGEVVQSILYHPNGKPAEVHVMKKGEKRVVYYDNTGKITNITKSENAKETEKK